MTRDGHLVHFLGSLTFKSSKVLQSARSATLLGSGRSRQASAGPCKHLGLLSVQELAIIWKLLHPWDLCTPTEEVREQKNRMENDQKLKFHTMFLQWPTGILILQVVDTVLIARLEDERYGTIWG